MILTNCRPYFLIFSVSLKIRHRSTELDLIWLFQRVEQNLDLDFADFLVFVSLIQYCAVFV